MSSNLTAKECMNQAELDDPSTRTQLTFEHHCMVHAHILGLSCAPQVLQASQAAGSCYDKVPKHAAVISASCKA